MIIIVVVVVVIGIKSNYTSFSFAVTQQQHVSALHIARNIIFVLAPKECYFWHETEPQLCRYGSRNAPPLK